jgi:hypothetical protein
MPVDTDPVFLAGPVGFAGEESVPSLKVASGRLATSGGNGPL